jgi:hypothetical protein
MAGCSQYNVMAAKLRWSTEQINTVAETAGCMDLLHSRQDAAQPCSQRDNSDICQGAHKYKETREIRNGNTVNADLVYTTNAYRGAEL